MGLLTFLARIVHVYRCMLCTFLRFDKLR